MRPDFDFSVYLRSNVGVPKEHRDLEANLEMALHGVPKEHREAQIFDFSVCLRSTQISYQKGGRIMRVILKGHKGMKSIRAPSKVDELSPDAKQALHDIVTSILRRTGVGRGIPVLEAIDGTIALIERGFFVLEHDSARQTCTLVPT